MAAGATFDTSSFNRMMGDLVTVGGPGTNAAAAMRGEVGSLLKVCIQYTPQATQAKIRARANYRFNEKYAIRGSGDLKVTMNDGSRKGAAVAENVWMRSGGKWYIMRGAGRWQGQEKEGGRSRFSPNGARWPERIWAQYQSLIDQTPEELAAIKKQWIAQALASQGLARQSWLQIADALGIEVPGVDGKLRQIKGSDGRPHYNGRGVDASTGDVLAFELLNQMPALAGGSLDGEGIWSRASATRLRAFDIALEKGIFQDLEQVRRRYPGLLA